MCNIYVPGPHNKYNYYILKLIWMKKKSVCNTVLYLQTMCVCMCVYIHVDKSSEENPKSNWGREAGLGVGKNEWVLGIFFKYTHRFCMILWHVHITGSSLTSVFCYKCMPFNK